MAKSKKAEVEHIKPIAEKSVFDAIKGGTPDERLQAYIFALKHGMFDNKAKITSKDMTDKLDFINAVISTYQSYAYEDGYAIYEKTGVILKDGDVATALTAKHDQKGIPFDEELWDKVKEIAAKNHVPFEKGTDITSTMFLYLVDSGRFQRAMRDDPEEFSDEDRSYIKEMLVYLSRENTKESLKDRADPKEETYRPIDYYSIKNNTFIKEAVRIDSAHPDKKLIIITNPTVADKNKSYDALVGIVNKSNGKIESVIPLPLFDKLAGGIQNYDMEELSYARKYGSRCLPDLQKLNINELEESLHAPNAITFNDSKNLVTLVEQMERLTEEDPPTSYVPAVISYKDDMLMVLIKTETGDPMKYHNPSIPQLLCSDCEILLKRLDEEGIDIHQFEDITLYIDVNDCEGQTLREFIRKDFNLFKSDIEVSKGVEFDISGFDISGEERDQDSRDDVPTKGDTDGFDYN